MADKKFFFLLQYEALEKKTSIWFQPSFIFITDSLIWNYHLFLRCKIRFSERKTSLNFAIITWFILQYHSKCFFFCFRRLIRLEDYENSFAGAFPHLWSHDEVNLRDFLRRDSFTRSFHKFDIFIAADQNFFLSIFIFYLYYP